MKTKKINIEKTDINLAENYRSIEAFLISIFKITNSSIPSFSLSNKILANAVYPKLLDIREEIKQDIATISTLNIDVYDIVDRQQNAVSKLYTHLFPNMIYTLTQETNNLKKIEKLEATFPKKDREIYIKKLDKSIEQKELLKSNMEAIGSKLADTYAKEIQELNKEKEAIEKTLNPITLDTIENRIRQELINRLEGYLTRTKEDIAFLERVHGFKEV